MYLKGFLQPIFGGIKLNFVYYRQNALSPNTTRFAKGYSLSLELLMVCLKSIINNNHEQRRG
jgi:hypothetical protein